MAGISIYVYTNNQNSAFFSEQTLMLQLILAYFSGFFYASFLTVPLSVILLISLSAYMNPYLLVAAAGLGAATGDLFIIKVFRTIFKVFSFARHKESFKSLKRKLKLYHLDLIALVLGSIIVASPFPDELGLILLGASGLSYFRLAILTLFLNSTGILIIILAIQSIR